MYKKNNIRKHAFTLAEGATHVAKSDNVRKAAFTLAEVLITIAIIGVVAAMTIPTLIQDYKEKVTITKVKKMYSTLTNAYQLYSAENGPIGNIPLTEDGAKQAFEIFKPYLKIANDCGTKGQECIYNGNYKILDGTSWYNYNIDNKYYKIILSDSSTLIFRGGTAVLNIKLEVFYDINGKEGPNQWGVDLFEFDLVDNAIITPIANMEEMFSNGYNGSTWIVRYGNMDYLHCPDELSWNGKHSCKD